MRYFAHGGKVPKTPPGGPGPQERGRLLNWLGGGGGYVQAVLQNLKAGKPTPQTWQKYTAKRGILTRPLRGRQRQDGVSTSGYCALRRRREYCGAACGRVPLRRDGGCGCHVWQPYKVSGRPAIEAVGPPYTAAAFSRSASEKLLRLHFVSLRMTIEGAILLLPTKTRRKALYFLDKDICR